MRRVLVSLLAAVSTIAAVDPGDLPHGDQLAPGSRSADRTALRLWYQQPAAAWNDALPIGNGRLGAMVFGGPVDERLQLNDDTVWAGETRDRLNPAGPAAVTEVRRLLFAGRALEAEAL